MLSGCHGDDSWLLKVEKIAFKGQMQEASCQRLIRVFRAKLSAGAQEALSGWRTNREASFAVPEEDVKAKINAAVQAAESEAREQQAKMNATFEAHLSALQQEIGGEADRGLREVRRTLCD